MTNIVHVKLIIFFVALSWLVANAPLIGVLVRHYSSPQLCWKVWTSIPNRYLFNLLFMPALAFAAYSVWELLAYLIGAEAHGLPKGHLLLTLSHSQFSLPIAVAMASLFTAWDYAAGNYCYADYWPPVAAATFAARDVVLAPAAGATAAPLPRSGPAFDMDALQGKLLGNTASTREARSFLVNVLKDSASHTDPLMLNLNLVRVWVFAFVVWLALDGVLMLAFLRLCVAPREPSVFITASSLSSLSVFIIAIWTALRSYELQEYKAIFEVDSAESVDVLIGIVSLVVGCVALKVCFEWPVIAIFGFLLGPLVAILGSYMFNSYVRQWFGSAMTATNFAVITFVCVTLYVILFTMFIKSKVA
jgi:hypothetical protein